jgi:2-polyprenyl-3-methyl-5-hydroxy-6-metoxy-1,4-benzoquinol methylase
MERSSARIMADTMIGERQPLSVLDLGAGPCGHANAMAGTEREVVAVDGSVHAESFAGPGVTFRLADLTKPLNLGRCFDLVLCLEVAEHLPESAAEILCANMHRHTGDSLVLTAAPPGQEGRHHINLKPKAYWIDLLIRLGLLYDLETTRRWQGNWRQREVKAYYWQNLMVFTRPEDSSTRAWSVPVHE